MATWLITRPEEDADPLLEALTRRGHDGIIAPMLEIAFSDDAQPLNLDGAQGLIFTSANGVRAFVRIENRRDLPVYTVGDASAASAREAGFDRVASASGAIEDLADLIRRRVRPAEGVLVHIGGNRLAGDLAGMLSPAGFAIRREIVYRSVAATVMPEPACAALCGRAIAGVLFFSPRTAEVFATLAQAAGLNDRLGGLIALCLSSAVARQLERSGGLDAWAAVRVAERPVTDALLDLADQATADLRRLATDRADPGRTRAD